MLPVTPSLPFALTTLTAAAVPLPPPAPIASTAGEKLHSTILGTG